MGFHDQLNLRHRKRRPGFTLIELLVALVIVALLAAIAIPYYGDFSRSSRRTEGTNALVQVATLEERWFTENGTYTSNLSDLGLENPGLNTTENGYYEFDLLASSTGCDISNCFVLEARPAPDSAQADDNIQYRISSDGLRESLDVDAGVWEDGWNR